MHGPARKPRSAWMMLIMAAAAALLPGAAPARAVLPDADIVSGRNRAGFGFLTGICGQADFALSERSALGGSFGFDHNDLFFADFDSGDDIGIALSHPFDDRWTGRANLVYGPAWGFEVGYRFASRVEGTFGITGLGVVGLGFRF